MDYDTARFKSSEVARAAGIEINSFRSYFKRGQFQMVGEAGLEADGQAAETHGAAHRWSLRDAMGFAVAGELIRAGADPKAAFNAAMWGFAHMGSIVTEPGPEDQPPLRGPGELWDARTIGFTLMAFFPQSGAARVFPLRYSEGQRAGMEEILYDPETQQRSTSILVFLNDVEHRVFTTLGVHEPAGR